MFTSSGAAAWAVAAGGVVLDAAASEPTDFRIVSAVSAAPDGGAAFRVSSAGGASVFGASAVGWGAADGEVVGCSASRVQATRPATISVTAKMAENLIGPPVRAHWISKIGMGKYYYSAQK